MPLVDGTNFVEYVRSHEFRQPFSKHPLYELDMTADPIESAHKSTSASNDSTTIDCNSAKCRAPARVLSDEQLGRLRDALFQLACGLSALHDAGVLHRDIKPSNVLVTKSGHVYLLDFGLATTCENYRVDRSVSGHVVGTVWYMSPEQAAGEKLTAASDWYSVGVILFELLTGRLPSMEAKHRIMGIQPLNANESQNVLSAGPDDLRQLCTDLLSRNPDSRPAGQEIIERLRPKHILESQASHSISTIPGFVGYRRELDTLTQAFEATASGRLALVRIRGKSGSGKTTLARHFCESVVVSRRAAVLSGRCYDRETVPFPGVDSIVDSLSRYLQRLPLQLIDSVLPSVDSGPLLHLFPVLRCVDALQSAQRRKMVILDRQELKRRAISVLREILTRLAFRTPLVLYIDDCQWSDKDSAELLNELLLPPDPPALLLLLCSREEGGNGFLITGFPCEGYDVDPPFVRDVSIDGMDVDDAKKFATELILRGGLVNDVEDHAASIARESQGNPYLIGELVKTFLLGMESGGMTTPVAKSDINVGAMVWRRVQKLPDSARGLLEVVAVAGRPISPAVASAVLVDPTEVASVLSTLVSAQLLTTTRENGDMRIEVYHDRVRESILSQISSEQLKGCHLRLAKLLECDSGADPAYIANQYLGAEHPTKAAEYYAIAAEKASSSLAFDLAARLYQAAIGLREALGYNSLKLRRNLASALANGGRNSEAAELFWRVSSECDGTEREECQRQAMVQYLISGHLEQGLDALDAVCRTFGLSVPTSPQRAVVKMLVNRIWLLAGGMTVRERAIASQRDLQKIDLTWSATIGLLSIDPFRAAYFHTQNLHLAKRSGDVCRISRALALEAVIVGMTGGKTRLRSLRIQEQAEVLADRTGDAYLSGLTKATRAMVLYMLGELKKPLELFGQADNILRHQCTGVSWELDTVNLYSIWCLSFMGEIAELSRRVPGVLKEARGRGNLYLAISSAARAETMICLGADAPDSAAERLGVTMQEWQDRDFQLQNHVALVAQTQIDLYRGDGNSALNRLEAGWPSIRKSQLLRIQVLRTYIHYLRACSALAAASRAPNGHRYLNSAARDASHIERERIPFAEAASSLIRAGIAGCSGDRIGCARLLESAATRFEALDMQLYSCAATRRRGEVLGGSEGTALIERANAWMDKQRIVNPEAMARMHVPFVVSHI